MHVFGTAATDIVHICQAVMGCGGTSTTWPTRCSTTSLPEACTVAALDASDKIRNITRIDG